MDTRKILLAVLSVMGLGASAVFGQDWTADPRYATTYPGTVTRTTVTTYTPAYQGQGDTQPQYAPPADAQPSYTEPQYAQPTYVQTQYTQPYAQPTYVQPAYAQPAYVQPTYAQPAYLQPTYPQPTYVTQAAYARPAYVPTAYVRPVYVARPMVVAYPAPVYRPVVQTYVPTYAAYPAATAPSCSVPTYQATAVTVPPPVGPRVVVHQKVYVEGQPLRNLLTAITP
jgi:hypothetical protein